MQHKYYYFVKWINYLPKYNTWEPEENFPEDNDILIDYKI